ncbi:MAG TPA: TetR/AcrR family transcriptional regulator C-terminal domain-containing protein [Streptosporangiaceae bacterium]|nr:TetR/AcrR family transcriptional regulator C-terminal domain-containing protein [Streptosporangiaceae bacterium]
MPVNREQIVAGALDLLDEGGLAGLTLRQLAGRLGIRAPTLYWHVRDKRELLDLLAAAILDEALSAWREPQPGQPWWEWLAARARVMRTALLAHRDSAMVVSGNRPAESSLPGIERQLRALGDAGFAPHDGLLALLTLNSYVIGDVLDQQAEDAQARPATEPIPGPGGATAPYPLLQAAARGLSSPGQRFEHGLGVIIDGLRVRHPG